LVTASSCEAGEAQVGIIDTGGFHDAALLRDVAEKHGQSAILRIGVLLVADAAAGAVQVQGRVAAALRERHLGRHSARRGAVEVVHRLVGVALDVAAVQLFAHARVEHGRAVTMDQAGAVQFTEDGHDAAGAMHVFHVVLLRRRRHFGQAGNPA
jgi:hypothetical protein